MPWRGQRIMKGMTFELAFEAGRSEIGEFWWLKQQVQRCGRKPDAKGGGLGRKNPRCEGASKKVLYRPVESL